MGCCLATLIPELPAWAAQANKSTSAFLAKLEKEECEDDDDDDDHHHHHTTGRAALGFVGYDNKDCAPLTAIATATATCPFAKQRRTNHAAAAASSKECITPTAIANKQSCSKKERKSRSNSFKANQSCS